MGFGRFPRVSYKEACDLADKYTKRRDDGGDPIEARKRERAETRAKEKGPVTFRQEAEAYLEAHGSSWKHRYAKAVWLNPLVAYGYPVLENVSLNDAAIEHVIAVMKAAETAGAAETARRLRARIEAILDFAIAHGHRDAVRGNPASAKLIATVHPSKRKGERAHYRAVDLDDAPAIFRELQAQAQDSTALSAWALMILCACRPSEALNAQWSEINLDAKVWVIPSQRMKSPREHAIPLSDAAVRVLERQAKFRTGEAVFPGRGGSPLSYNVFATAPANAKPPIDGGTPHSWRSIFRDWAGDKTDFPRDLSESALAHSLGPTEAAYRRRTAIEKRRLMMSAYSNWLEAKGADVIAFRGKAL
jgi:integrase